MFACEDDIKRSGSDQRKHGGIVCRSLHYPGARWKFAAKLGYDLVAFANQE